MERQLLSGDEAVALAAVDAGVALGTGYPGTPSTEILEAFSELGGRAQWAPNEKVALEVGLGAAFANARTIVTMKHVGLNVAADPLFTSAYTGVAGALIVVSADDPGMSSSQNEQDNRRYAVAAGLPAIEPSDSQEAYDFFFAAVEISERWKIPVLYRMTTRVCHSKSVVVARSGGPGRGRPGSGASARPALRARHRRPGDDPGQCPPGPPAAAGQAGRDRRLGRGRWKPRSRVLNRVEPGDRSLGIVTSGVSYLHAAEAAPGRQLPQDRPRQPAADRARPRLRRLGRALRRRGGGRSRDRRLAARRRHPRGIQGGDVPLRRAGRGARPPHPGRRRHARAGPAPRQAAGAVPGLPVPHRLRNAGEARLHRRRRHRLLHPGRPAAVQGDGLVRGHGRLDRRRPGAAPRPAAGGGAARGLGDRRLHVRPLRHHRPGGDGLQPAAHGPRRARAGQRHDRHDRPAGAPGHRPHARPRPHEQALDRGHRDAPSASAASPSSTPTPTPKASSGCCSSAWPRPSFRSSSPAGRASWRRPTFGSGSSRRPSFGPGLRPRRPSTCRVATNERARMRSPASPTSSSPASAARASSRPRTSSPTRPFEPASTSRRPRSTA